MTEYFVTKVVPCQHCGGAGVVNSNLSDEANGLVDCPFCNGSAHALQMVPLIEALAKILPHEFCVALPNHPGAGQIMPVPRGDGESLRRKKRDELEQAALADERPLVSEYRSEEPWNDALINAQLDRANGEAAFDRRLGQADEDFTLPTEPPDVHQARLNDAMFPDDTMTDEDWSSLWTKGDNSSDEPHQD